MPLHPIYEALFARSVLLALQLPIVKPLEHWPPIGWRTNATMVPFAASIGAQCRRPGAEEIKDMYLKLSSHFCALCTELAQPRGGFLGSVVQSVVTETESRVLQRVGE